MRLLVTIPHYFRRGAEEPGFYGSESNDPELRRAAVERCLAALHQTFGTRQAMLGPTQERCNRALETEIDVVLITSADQHLADQLPGHLFHHYGTKVEPRHLGFVCHEFLREHLGRYDWYAFLEDDIEVLDPLFLQKLAWFNVRFGPRAVLQPHRYEVAHDLTIMKLYVDGQTTDPGLSDRFQDISVRPSLAADAFGKTFVFRRHANVHAGCFFLDDAQLRRLARDERFGVPSSEFFGPLESAVTLPIMRNFEAYKPALENAAFLEVRHLGRRFLHVRQRAPA